MPAKVDCCCDHFRNWLSRSGDSNLFLSSWSLSREFICRKRSLALAVVHRGFPGEHVRDTAALLAIRARLYRRRGADVTAVAALITRVDRTHCCLSPPSADCGSCCCFHSAYRRTASIF